IELDRAQRGVERQDERPALLSDVRVERALADGRGDGDGGATRARGRPGHVVVPDVIPPPRSARFTALRTMTSFSPLARCSDSCAFLLPTFPNAIAAHARSSGSSRRPNSVLLFRSPSREGMPASPHMAPNASKNAIFSVRSAARMASPFTAVSSRLKTPRWLHAPSALTPA